MSKTKYESQNLMSIANDIAIDVPDGFVRLSPSSRHLDSDTPISNVYPLNIPDWCELEEYSGDKNIAFFDENE